MDIKIKCVICDKEIKNPNVGQLCCDSPKCKKEYEANMIELWKLENPQGKITPGSFYGYIDKQ